MLSVVIVGSISLVQGFQQAVLCDLNISVIPANDIPVNLTDIRLDHNLMDLLPASAFSDYTQLGNLSLSDNFITNISAAAFTNTSLAYLNLDDNLLTRIPNLTNIGATLRSLNIRRNRIGQITPKDFDALLKLQALELDGNNVRSFPLFGDATATLRTLYIGDNYISDIMPELFSNFAKLRRFGLSNNNLTNCPDFSQLPPPGLTSLKLPGNPLNNISSCLFNGLPNLKSLNLSELNGGPYIFEPISKILQLFHIDRTPLQDISSGFLDNIAIANTLQELLLRSTQLIRFPNPVTAFPAQLVFFRLSYNQFDCDCDLVWMVSDVYDPINLQLKGSTCSANSPTAIVGKLITNVTALEMCPETGKF